MSGVAFSSCFQILTIIARNVSKYVSMKEIKKKGWLVIDCFFGLGEKVGLSNFEIRDVDLEMKEGGWMKRIRFVGQYS